MKHIFFSLLLCILAFSGPISAQKKTSITAPVNGRLLNNRILPPHKQNLNAVNIASHRRNRADALTIAKERAEAKGITMVSKARRVAGTTADEDSVAAYYVFNNGNEKGWTIVSGSDQLDEILAYSDEGSLDLNDLPVQLKDLLNVYTNYADSIDSQTSSISGARKVMRRASSTTTSPIGPLCVTKWDQYTPYNNNCPTVSSGKHAATCCVATAFAQILYYLYYTKGKQESTTFTTAIPTPTNTAGYKGNAVAASDRTYEWSKMLTDYAGKDYTDEQAAAIAKLMADIGSSFNVKYGTTSSSSTTDDYMSSLTSSSYPHDVGPTYWGIAQPSDFSYTSSASSVSAWHTAIDGELDKYYPVQIGGNGHAFVCDGRDSNNMYHMNFGYDGRGDGFYSFDAIDGYGTNMRITYGMRLETTYPTAGLDKLQVVYDAATSYLDEEQVGTVPGYYQQEYYDALSAKLATGKTYLDNNGSGQSSDALTTFAEEISTAQQELLAHRAPYPTGTYYLKNFDEHSGTDVVMYASGSSVKYGALSSSNDNYKWTLTYNESNDGYTIKNVGTGTYINSVSSSAVTLGSSSSVYCEVWQTNRIEQSNSRYTNDYWDVHYNNTIRPIVSGYRDNDYGYVIISYADGTGGSTSGSLIGWQPYNDWDVWVPVPIDVDYTSLEKPTASFANSSVTIEIGSTSSNRLTTNSSGTVTYTSSNTSVATVDSNGNVTAVAPGTTTITAKIAKTDSYSAASVSYTVTVPEDAALRAQLDALIATAEGLYTAEELAEAIAAKTVTKSDGLITASSQFSSPYTESSEGSFDNLLDNDASTFWHSAWSGGSVSAGTHYFIVTLNAAEQDSILLSMTRRSSATADHVTQFEVYGSNDNSNWTDITTLNFTLESVNETVTSTFNLGASYTYLKFVCTNTGSTDGTGNRGYFHMGEFQLYRITTQYDNDKQKALVELDNELTEAKNTTIATKQAIDELQSAIDNYKGQTSGPVNPTISFKEQSLSLSIGSSTTNALTTNSDGAVTYTSSNTKVATVDANGKVTAVGEGTATITASVASTDNYNAATSTYTVTVGKQATTITLAKTEMTLTIDQADVNTITTNSTGNVTYTSSNTAVATVDAKTGEVTAVGAGTAIITVSIEATSEYAAATKTYNVIVSKKEQTVSFAQASVSIMVDETATNKASSTGDGTISYSSADQSIATVDENGVVTGISVGTTTITAKAAESNSYAEASATYTVTVSANTEYDDAMAELLNIQQYLYTETELAEAKAAGTAVKGDGLITESSQFSSPYTDSTEGSLENLLDGDATTYWHSTYQGGNVTAGTHYIEITLNEAYTGDVEFDITRRDFEWSGDSSWGNDFTSLKVCWSINDIDWYDLETISTAYSASGESFSNIITLPEGTKYVRVYFMSTNTGKGYSHIGDMQLYAINYTDKTEKQEALIALDEAYTTAKGDNSVTQQDISDLRAAIEAYTPTGDVNLDGKIDIADITWLTHYLKGNTGIKHGILDINADYKINTEDINQDTKGLRDIILTQ